MDRALWEQRLAEVWSSFDQHDEEKFRLLIEELADELPPGDPVADFERASALDSTGRPEQAVKLYQRALAAGLSGERRRRAVIQLASSLRVVGRATESVALLQSERDHSSDHLDDAVDAFLALALAETGREREALSLALSALAPHLPRYQRSVGAYALALCEEE